MEEAITTAATAASTDFVSILTAVASLAIGPGWDCRRSVGD